jgi:hypothetical protein
MHARLQYREHGCGGENHFSHPFKRQIRARGWAGTCGRGEEQSCWTWTKGASTPEGQVPAAEPLLRSGTPWTGHFLLAHSRSSVITLRPFFHPFVWQAVRLAPVSPRFACARPGPLISRNWPPVKPRLTVRVQFPRGIASRPPSQRPAHVLSQRTHRGPHPLVLPS